MEKLLVVIDMQNDFVTGTLGTAEAKTIVPAIRERISIYRAMHHKVFFTRDTHEPNYMSTNEGAHLPVIHCVKGTWGWQIEASIDALRKEADLVFDKPTFGSLELAQTLQALYEENPHLEIELVGVCTDICVISNALLIKAHLPEVAIKVNSTCCAGVSPESHEAALKTMTMCQIDRV